MNIEIRHLTKRFGAFIALDDVTLDVAPGELLALLGPSGCGKTTLLRILAGLETPDGGEIRFSGEDVVAHGAGERQVGFVFQHYALFRHMNVFENIAFGLRVRRANRPPRAEIRRRVETLLALIKMQGFGDRYPSQLSGGQRQRVALARALAVEPQVLLLDEPFGALDANVRKELRRWLRRLHDEIHVTSIFVTHDVEEALEVADRVVVMDAGRVAQTGTPDAVYEHPATPFVCRFLGSVNRFQTRQGGAVITAYARPHDIELTRTPDAVDALAAEVLHVQGVGPLVRVELRRCDDGQTIEVELTRERQLELSCRPGERLYVRPACVSLFPDVEP